MSCSLQRALDRLVRRDVLLEADEVLPSSFSIEIGFAWRTDALGLQISTSRSSRNGISLICGRLRRIRDHADVERAGEHVLVDLVRLLVLEADVDAGIRPDVALQLVGELVEPDGVDRRDPHGSGDDVREGLQAALEVLVAGDDLLADLVEDLARRASGRTRRLARSTSFRP